MSEVPNPSQRPETWGAGAPRYATALEPLTGHYAAEAVTLAGITTGTRVLDVAAGTGAFTVPAAVAGADVLATDFSPGMMTHLEQRLADEGLSARTARMDGLALDVDDAAFDVAASSFGIMFFPDPAAGVAELARATRAGGTVVVLTWLVEEFRLNALVTETFVRGVPGFQRPESGPSWAQVGSVGGLGEVIAATGCTPEVHVRRHHWRIEDPAAYFRALPEWSPPSLPLFDTLAPHQVDALAAVFAEVVAERTDERGIPTAALIGLGRR